MNRLALLAALLMLLVPTSNRLLGSHGLSDGVWAQICTMAGIELVKVPSDGIDPTPSRPADGGSMDCDYCPLLLATTALAICVLLVTPQPAARPLATFRALHPRRRGHPSGLGSRGPPLAL